MKPTSLALAVTIALSPRAVLAQTTASAAPAPSPVASASPAPVAPVTHAAVAVPSVAPTTPNADEASIPRLVHTPMGNAPNMHPVALEFDVVNVQSMRRLELHHRTGNSGPYTTLAIARAPRGPYRAVLPAPPLDAREIDYYVTITQNDGSIVEGFASPDEPHRIVLEPTWSDAQESQQLAMHRDQRLEFTVIAEGANYGTRDNHFGAQVGNPNAYPYCGTATTNCPDWWYRLGVGVEYHFFRFAQGITVHADRVTGFTARMVGNQLQEVPVGLVSASAEVEVRLIPHITAFIGGIIGANQNSVTGGASGRIAFGVDWPTRIEFMVSGIVDYGLLVSAWMRWRTLPWLPLGVGIEVTNQPGNGTEYGVRLLGEVSLPLGRYFTITGRGGYSARHIDVGGPSGAVIVALHF